MRSKWIQEMRMAAREPVAHVEQRREAGILFSRPAAVSAAWLSAAEANRIVANNRNEVLRNCVVD
jgi:hypothetical protein